MRMKAGALAVLGSGLMLGCSPPIDNQQDVAGGLTVADNYPAVKDATIRTPVATVATCGRLIMDSSLERLAPAAVRTLRDELRCSGASADPNIIFEKVAIEDVPPRVANTLSRSTEAYVLSAGVSGSGREWAKVRATTARGLLMGMVTLQQKMNAGTLDLGAYHDWPELPLRALHITINGLSDPASVRSLVARALRYKMNTVVLKMRNDTTFGVLAGRYKERHLISPDAVADLVAYTSDHGLRVVPEFNMLTKPDSFVLGHSQASRAPELGDATASLLTNWHYASTANKWRGTIDINSDVVVSDYISPLIDEIMGIFPDATAVHIGADEALGYVGATRIVGDGRSLAEVHRTQLQARGMAVLSKTEFLRYLDVVNTIIHEKYPRVRQVWIWGDMLNHPDDHPQLRNVHGLDDFSGDDSSTFGSIKKHLPNNIVAFPWHYFPKVGFEGNVTFDTVDAFIREGVRVGGAVWYDESTRQSYIDYMKSKRAESRSAVGMIAATFSPWINASAAPGSNGYANYERAVEIINEAGGRMW